MHGARSLAAFTLLLSMYQSTCRASTGAGGSGGGQPPSPDNDDVHLQGVDTSSFTERERKDFSTWVSELYAPCPNVPVTLVDCVRQQRACARCLPAAKLLAKQVRDGKTRSQAEEIVFARFAEDRLRDIDTSDSPSVGAPDAPVTLVEWADFQCPHCRHVVPLLEKTVTDHPGKVRLLFKFFPLQGHPHGEAAARAVAAAMKQGKFWQMHHIVFEHQDALEARDLEKYAKEIGLNVAKWKADSESEAVADRVARDRKQGEAVRLNHTPTLFINGREFAQGFSFEEDLNDWIDLDLDLASRGEPDGPKSGVKPAAAASSKPQ